MPACRSRELTIDCSSPWPQPALDAVSKHFIEDLSLVDDGDGGETAQEGDAPTSSLFFTDEPDDCSAVSSPWECGWEETS